MTISGRNGKVLMTCNVLLSAVAVVAVLAAAGCDDASTPSSPSPTRPVQPQIPQVAGTYTGSMTLTVAGNSLTGSGTMTVVQSGSQLTITGSATIAGETIQMPAVTGTINATGFFTLTGGGSLVSEWEDPTCGTMQIVSSTLTFSGRTLRYVESATTTLCGPLQISMSLSR